MAVTKRTRFEILRRDNHTCQYCGAKAPDVRLHIDHVMPVALGGDDTPGNLVTACADCNNGKTSVTPDSPLVQGMSDRAAAYALGMLDKMTKFRAEFERLEDYEAGFHEIWDRWEVGGKPFPLPIGYQGSLHRWMLMGVPLSAFEVAIPVAIGKFSRERYMQPDAVFPYAAGVLTNMLNSREIDLSVTAETAGVYTESEAQRFAFREYFAGVQAERLRHQGSELLAKVIDGGLDIEGMVRVGAG